MPGEEDVTTIPMSPETVRYIANGIRRTNHPMRGILSKPLTDRLRQGWDKLDVDEVAHTLATRRDRALSDDARNALRSTTLDIDPIARELVEDLGLDPDGLLLLAAVASPDQVNLGACLRVADPGRSRVTISVPLTPEISWHSPDDEVFMIGPMPEMLANALPGRRLAEWLSHPVLDRHPISITSVSITSIATRVATDAATASAATIRD